MMIFSPTRALLLSAITFALPISAYAQLPPAATTSYESQQAQTPQPPATKTAQITYAAGQLSVTASNSSLNQILRDISRQTGMKITGGVTEERVFGSYGPASPSKVITALLDGTGSNILLVQGATSADAPLELVLTPRHGGPTPPNPSARNDSPRSFNDNGPDPNRGANFNQTPAQYGNQPSAPASANQTAQPINPGTPAAAPPDGSAATPPAGFPTPPASSGFPTPPADNSTQQQSPNDVKTPQQIYEQLLKLRQQQTAPPQ